MVEADLSINRICEFLYRFANVFACVYKNYKVIKNQHSDQRIKLILAYKIIFEQCFKLLGISPVDKL